jgi:hypothetical protein
MSHPFTVNQQGERINPQSMARRGERRVYEPKKLWDSHHEVLNQLSLGIPRKVVAENMGVTPQTVSNVANSELGKEKLTLMRGARDASHIDVMAEVSRMIPKALAVYEEILDADASQGVSLNLKKHVADTLVMKIGGYEAPRKLDVRSASLHLNPEELEELKERGRQAAHDLGLLATRKSVPQPSDG